MKNHPHFLQDSVPYNSEGPSRSLCISLDSYLSGVCPRLHPRDTHSRASVKVNNGQVSEMHVIVLCLSILFIQISFEIALEISFS